MQPGVRLRSFCEAVGVGRSAEKTPCKTRNGSSAMGHDVANVRCAIRCAAANQADYGPADVCVVLDGRLIHVGNKTSAAASRSRAMRIDHRLPPIEFLEYRFERLVAQPL